MILAYRISDNQIINYRQTGDWGKYAQLTQQQEEYANLPGNTSQEVKDAYLQAIANLEADKQDWYDRFITNAGGNPATYDVIQVPPDEISQALAARYITFDGQNLTYDLNPIYSIVGSVIAVYSGWVKGNERLMANDETDFSSLTLTEPLFFKLAFCQNVGTQEINVQLFTRDEDEEFGDVPANLQELYTICQGRVNIDNSITEGVF